MRKLSRVDKDIKEPTKHIVEEHTPQDPGVLHANKSKRNNAIRETIGNDLHAADNKPESSDWDEGQKRVK